MKVSRTLKTTNQRRTPNLNVIPSIAEAAGNFLGVTKMTQNLDRLLQALWIKMCRHEGIRTNCKFVVFSDANPYQSRYDKVMRIKLAAMQYVYPT